MTIQTIELAGQRFVILPEPEFRELERRLLENQPGLSGTTIAPGRYEAVAPFQVSGESASEMLIRERR